jgi:hypothetical protein
MKRKGNEIKLFTKIKIKNCCFRYPFIPKFAIQENARKMANEYRKYKQLFSRARISCLYQRSSHLGGEKKRRRGYTFF